MSARHDFDAQLETMLEDLGAPRVPEYLDEVFALARRTRQRPAWTSPGRWLPMQLTFARVAVPRAVPILIVLALALAAGLIAVALVGGRRQVPPPFGRADTGLIAYGSLGEIFVVDPDGRAPHALFTAANLQYGATWSRDGTRVAYWSTTSEAGGVNAPARLWVANPDGTGARSILGDRTFAGPGSGPAVTWSPDGRHLAFSTNEGDLYVVGVDGSDLRLIGDRHQRRFEPAWSPDGTLIAFRGSPLDNLFPIAPFVIRPDGSGETQIAPPGGDEATHVNLNWSPDGAALIYQAGGSGDTDIAEARRGPDGTWSEHMLVQRAGYDDMPVWSNDGTRFAFLREGPSGETVHVADADGSNIRQLSTRVTNLAPLCWSPDDRLVRATAPQANQTDRTILLIPVDGSPVIEIAAPALVDDGACGIQRVQAQH